MTDPTANSELDDTDVLSLARGYCDGMLHPPEMDRLETLLRGNRAAQKQFLSYVDIHARLCWQIGRGLPSLGAINPPKLPVQVDIATPGASWSIASIGTPTMFLLLALVLLLTAIRFAWPGASREAKVIDRPAPVTIPALATVTQANGRWIGRTEAVQEGEVLAAGTVNLAQGIVELKLRNEVVVLLEAPTRLELISEGRVFLHSGRVVAKVGEKGVGFVIDTSLASLVDLGTEFGVAVDPDRSTQVQVFDGIVDAKLRSSVQGEGCVERLTAGQARLIDRAQPAVVLPTEFHPNRFTRTFPAAPVDRRIGPQIPFNHSRYELLHVGKVKQAPVIDGDLSEWNRDRALISRCIDPFGERYYVEAMINYDDQRLYVAAHVGDPAPMENKVDARLDPVFYWAGGSVLLRVGASNSFGWPLMEQSSSLGGPESLQTVDLPPVQGAQIAHVGLWYSKLLKRPQLMIAYGIENREVASNPDGWQGVFKKDADGRGYCFEYALPWSLLHADGAPRSGDCWPASWTVHWSDEKGRTCTGELVELTNFGRQPYHFLSGPTWGKLIFDPE